jgi:hypothetical protein
MKGFQASEYLLGTPIKGPRLERLGSGLLRERLKREFGLGAERAQERQGFDWVNPN